VTGGIYPYLRCGRHLEQLRLGYCACVHVVYQHAPIAHLLKPTDTSAGEVLCFACVNREQLNTDDLLAVCELCVQEITRARR